jgi:hypothetical protein
MFELRCDVGHLILAGRLFKQGASRPRQCVAVDAHFHSRIFRSHLYTRLSKDRRIVMFELRWDVGCRFSTGRLFQPSAGQLFLGSRIVSSVTSSLFSAQTHIRIRHVVSFTFFAFFLLSSLHFTISEGRHGGRRRSCRLDTSHCCARLICCCSALGSSVMLSDRRR